MTWCNIYLFPHILNNAQFKLLTITNTNIKITLFHQNSSSSHPPSHTHVNLQQNRISRTDMARHHWCLSFPHLLSVVTNTKVLVYPQSNQDSCIPRFIETLLFLKFYWNVSRIFSFYFPWLLSSLSLFVIGLVFDCLTSPTVDCSWWHLHSIRSPIWIVFTKNHLSFFVS